MHAVSEQLREEQLADASEEQARPSSRRQILRRFFVNVRKEMHYMYLEISNVNFKFPRARNIKYRDYSTIFPANFTGLVLGCIEAKFCKKNMRSTAFFNKKMRLENSSKESIV